MKIYFTTIYLTLFFFTSCKQSKNELTAAAHTLNPVAIEPKGYTVPPDGMPKWKITPLKNPTVFPAGDASETSDDVF